MPAILQPEEVVEKRPTRRADESDIGGGKLPPIAPKGTGGGGEGDNWKNNPVGRRGPRERLQTFRMGMFAFLAGDTFVFFTIILVFFVNKHAGHVNAYNQYVVPWQPVQVPSILWLNTAALLLSSLTVERARKAVFHEMDVMEEWLGLGTPTRRRVMPWLGASVVLGALFVWGQLVAWRQLTAQHIVYTGSQSSRLFYLITGIHGAHLILGLVLLVGALIGMRTLRTIQSRQIAVDSTAWYWHTMGALWIVLFALLLWGQ